MQRPSHAAAAGFIVEPLCLMHGQKKLIPEMQFRAHVLGTHSVFVLACEDERFEDKPNVPCPAEVLERIGIGMERQSEDVARRGGRSAPENMVIWSELPSRQALRELPSRMGLSGRVEIN